MRRTLLTSLTVACATVASATTAISPQPAAAEARGSTTSQALTAPANRVPSAVRPVLSAEARARGLNTTHGAVPGWRAKTITATSTSSATPISSAHASTSVTASVSLSGVSGIDVSGWSGTVNWRSYRAQGTRYVYAKATEGTYYVSRSFASQASGARAAGLIVGAYTFANPGWSSGKAQADYFIAHGGMWRPGRLPGVLDMEWNPYQGNACYNLTKPQMIAWVKAFMTQYARRTGTYPVIYTSRSWWNLCVGTSTSVSWITARSPLWVTTLSTRLGTLPYNWYRQRFWQYGMNKAGTVDYNKFNGNLARLQKFAKRGY